METIEPADPPAQTWEIVSFFHLDYISIILILFILLLLLFSALISGSEVAFFSIGRPVLFNLEKSDNKSERSIYRILTNPKKLLASILIVNNLINVAIVTLTTYTTSRIVPSEMNNALIGSIVVISTAIFIAFFGEMLPKIYANQKNLSFAKRMISPLTFINNILTPFSNLLVSSTNFIEKKLANSSNVLTSDELSKAIELTTQSNDISKEEKDILNGIANFGNISAKQIMHARTEIEAFNISYDFHDLMDKINKTGHSRIPVFEDTIDNIVGILYIKDLLPFTSEDEDFNWRKYIRTPYFVPETKKIDDLLKNFQKKRVHMAIIVDEYGGTSGLITLEDIIEEIVGEISDEFDDDEIEYTRKNENEYVFEGKTSLNDFCKMVNLGGEYFDNVKGESESLGGLMQELFSKMPSVGEEITHQNVKFTIHSVNPKRVKKINIKIIR